MDVLHRVPDSDVLPATRTRAVQGDKPGLEGRRQLGYWRR
jgi:hypothetical protein